MTKHSLEKRAKEHELQQCDRLCPGTTLNLSMVRKQRDDGGQVFPGLLSSFFLPNEPSICCS